MIDIILFTFLIFLSGFFSSSETAFFSLSQAKVRLMKSGTVRCGQKTAEIIESLKRRPQELLVTILIGNNIVNLFTASYATVVATEHFNSGALGIATGVTTLMILIFGEIIPKSFAYSANVAVARATAWPLHFLRLLLLPIVILLIALNRFFARWFGHDVNARENVTEEEVRTMSRLGVESGKIDYREHEMIENIFQFDDTKVRDTMTPWYKVVAISGAVPVEQIAHFVSHEQYTRYPVHDGKNEDNIIGYIHMKDLMKVLNSDDRERPVGDFVLPLTRIAESDNIERIFRWMVRDKAHVFAVHDDGAPDDLVGLITLEDIVEEIVGEIVDETDREE